MMSKPMYVHLMDVRERHKKFHVRNMLLMFACSVMAACVLGCVSLWLNSPVLFVFLIALLLLRTFYLFAKGDWRDLALQLGLRCQGCGCVYHRDEALAHILQNNQCPGCGQVVYEDQSGK